MFPAVFVMVSVLAFADCGGGAAKPPATPQCVLSSDCKNTSLQCAQGYCVNVCNTSVDCPSGQRCIATETGNTCQPPEKKTCGLNSDCTPLFCALDLVCRNECTTDVDCPGGGLASGQKCTESKRCVDPALDKTYDPATNDFKPRSGTGGAGGGFASAAIGPAGGTVSTSGAKVVVGAGALGQSTTVSITAVASGYPALATNQMLQSKVFAFEPHGLTFGSPVQITIPYVAPTGASLQLITSSPGGAWTVVDGATFASMSAQASVTHFSFFAVILDGVLDGGGSDKMDGIAPAPDASDAGDASGADGGAARMPVILVPFNPDISLIGPGTIAIDDGYVYWVGGDTAGTIRVQRVPKAGGAVTVAYQPPIRPAQGAPGPFTSPTLAVDATSLYVTIGFDIYTSNILKVAKDGSTHDEPSLLQVDGLGRDASMLAIDSQNVYFTALGGGIARVPINGGPRATVVSPYLNGQDGPPAPGPNDPISGMPIGFPNINYYTLVSDGTNVYYAANHWMLKAPVGGGAPVVLVPNATDAANVDYVGCISHPAVTGGYVYWINLGDVFRVSVNGVAPGGKPETLVTGMAHGDCGYAVTDGQSIYYLDGGNIWKLAVTGGAPVKLFDFGSPTNYSLGAPIVVDDTSVYLVAFGGHGIVKIEK